MEFTHQRLLAIASNQTEDKAPRGLRPGIALSFIPNQAPTTERFFDGDGPPGPIFPILCSILASFFRFIQAYVSPTFIRILAFPFICVYRNPCASFAVPNSRSIVSLRWLYISFIPMVCRISSHISRYGSQMCLVTTFWWIAPCVHRARCGQLLQILGLLLYSR